MFSFKSLTLYTLLFAITLLGNLIIILLDNRITESMFRRLYRYIYPVILIYILFIEMDSYVVPFLGIFFIIFSMVLLFTSRQNIYIPRVRKDLFFDTIFPILEELKLKFTVERNRNSIILDKTTEIIIDSNERTLEIVPSYSKHRSLIVKYIEENGSPIRAVRRKQIAETGIITGVFCGIIFFYTVVVQNGRLLL